nr:EAL domain-containing protein [Thalassobacillus sp. CUG 92003]
MDHKHPWNILKQLALPVWFFDLESQMVSLNKSFREQTGLMEASITLAELGSYVGSDDVKNLSRKIERAKSGGCAPDDHDQVASVFDAHDSVIGFTGFEKQERQTEIKLRRIRDMIIDLERERKSESGESFLQFLTRYLAEQFSVETVLIGKMSDTAPEVADIMAMCQSGKVDGHFSYPLKGKPCRTPAQGSSLTINQGLGSHFPQVESKYESYIGTPLISQEGGTVGFISVFDHKPLQEVDFMRLVFQMVAGRVVSDLYVQQVEQELHALSKYDALTGLFARDHFIELLKQEVAHHHGRTRRFGLMFIDLDNFKMVNDTLGHDRGDELLQQFAMHLQRIFADTDAILSRVSSDEFLVLVPHITGAEDLAENAEQILESMKQPFFVEYKEYYHTASLGLALCPDDAVTGDLLLRYADAAMYRAKERGKNTYEFYNRNMSEELHQEMQRKQALYHALDNDEFVLHYQPQVDVESGEILGFEALIRWQQPNIGLMSPHHFIELAEESGLITQIGEWVTEEACRQITKWKRGYGRPDLKVSVNLSAQQFNDRHLIEKTLNSLKAANLSPQNLIIEITETMVLHDFEQSIEVLDTLRQKGIEIHLDDFGVGFSSLNYLSRLPVDAIKIDRSFVSKIGEASNDAAIVNAIIAMAKSLGLRIIAEGVETHEHIEYLRHRKCTEFQGFYFSKPLPDHEVEEYVLDVI